MQIIAYTYEAAFHCVKCAQQRFGNPANAKESPKSYDECGILIDQTDLEGNRLLPIFSTDETPAMYCDDCHQLIEA